MSRFLSSEQASLKPYVPGEQPQDRQYIKLNTNENPFPPSEEALRRAAEQVRSFELYSDPEARVLRAALAERYQVSPDWVTVGNGSDEVLNMAFLAFVSPERPALFPDITYGFYRVFADVNRLPWREIPLEDDLTVRLDRYAEDRKPHVVFLANPNAPTGIALPAEEIARLARRCPDSLVIVDEAYVDFGAESCVPLTRQLDNLLVIQTFSKSRSMAGARLGYAIGQPQLIADLQSIRYSLNPYNVNSYTQALGIAVLQDEARTRRNCETIIANRGQLAAGLKALGFAVTDSRTNFLFARTLRMNGGVLYQMLKDRGILVRHFNQSRIVQYNRITVGTREQNDALLAAIRDIL